MPAEAALPLGFWERVQKMIDDGVAKFARSGFLRNASITGGAGLTIADGGSLKAQTTTGVNEFYVGGGSPLLGDGSPQPLVILRRADGTIAMAIYDPAPGSGGFQQFLAVYDRSGNNILSDDTDSGQGLARPYIGGTFVRARYTDWNVSTVSPTFETLWRGEVRKQHPRMSVATLSSMDTAATTGEIQVFVNGVQLGTTASIGFAQTTTLFGPAAVAGAHMTVLAVEIKARVTSGTGTLRVEPLHMQGRQS